MAPSPRLSTSSIGKGQVPESLHHSRTNSSCSAIATTTATSTSTSSSSAGKGAANGDGASFAASELDPELQEKKLVVGRTLHSSFYILSWIFFSNVTILFNKWLIDNAGFRYPILLTCWHLVFATMATRLLARFTSLLDSRHSINMDRRLYIRTILPIGLLYSGSLVCSNVVYLYLSVPFIQMLKSASPVVVLFFSWLWGLADPTAATLLNIVVIVVGVSVASVGEIQFSWMGFMYQVGGTVFEALRLVMIQVMLSSEGLKMDPLVSLYYFAPICAATNFMVALWSEIPRFQVDDIWSTGPSVLILNALVAFMLNIASVCLIGKTSGLVMTLTGILKSILLVVVSVFLWQTHITLVQSIGYSIALSGLVYYSLGHDQLACGYHAASSWASNSWKTSRDGVQNQWKSDRRRLILAAAGLCLISTLLVVSICHGPLAIRRFHAGFFTLRTSSEILQSANDVLR